MADNVRITSRANATPPDGTVIATDEVSGVQYQIMKLATGADGEASLVSETNALAVAIPVSSPSTQAELEHKRLLEQILLELKYLRLHMEQITELKFTESDANVY